MTHDDERDAMDAYSTVVIRVAELVLPSVASLRVRTRRGEGGGSASVLTADGFLLTSAHVVTGAGTAEVAFADGTDVSGDGGIHCRTWLCSALAATSRRR